MNVYLIIILSILIAEYVLEVFVERLNLRSASGLLPSEFQGYYDAQKYRKAQEYLKDNTRFKIIKSSFFTAVIVVFILRGGFNLVDKFARSFALGPIATGLVFAGVLLLGLKFIGVPFSVYHTFVIEEKFGFNRSSVKTFVLDFIKSLFLGAIIGGLVFSVVLWFFGKAGPWAWAYCWVAVTFFQFFLVFIAPIVILPLFNKYIPLEEGELRSAIEEYADSQDFKIKGIFKMDASRRSSKSNAFFTGFGRFRRIALFDTLISKHTVEELVSVLAHEIGHYKKKHIIRQLGLTIFTNGLMFYVLSLFIKNSGLFAAFKMEYLSNYASLFFFAFLYTPISLIFSVMHNVISRRHEYEADAYVLSTYKKPEAFVEALKKLSVDNLSNLTPHPIKVFFDYSHPPVLQRIQAIRKIRP
ncbi:MAG: M48 family metallopeptidase [Candidatus Omnitrophica bacterium]|nr:M48 family metallopeptidase [Candidatus Omnitrophota bacterium]